jgi:hypothetical protein
MDLSKLGFQAIPINWPSTLFVNGVDKYIDEGGGVWLKSGVVEDDLSLYPYATRTEIATAFKGKYASTALRLYGLTNDDTYLYLISADPEYKVIKYSASGAEVSRFSYASQSTSIKHIAFNGTHLLLVATNGTVYVFTTAGVYTNSTFILSMQVTYNAITCDETYIWAVGGSTVYRHNKDTGAFTNFSFTHALFSGKTLTGIGHDKEGNLFIAINQSSSIVYKFDKLGSYLGETNDVSLSQLTSDITILKNDVYISDYNGDAIVHYKRAYYVVGSPAAKVENGYPVYLKVGN